VNKTQITSLRINKCSMATGVGVALMALSNGLTFKVGFDQGFHVSDAKGKQAASLFKKQAVQVSEDAYNEGVREGRKGWTEIPKENGVLIVRYRKNDSTPVLQFSPDASTNQFHLDQPWDSEDNQKAVEYLVNNGMTYDYGSGQTTVNLSAAACISGVTTNYWGCVYRVLGSRSAQLMVIEVDPKNRKWRSAPFP